MSMQSILLSSSEWPSELAKAGLTARDVDRCLGVIEETCNNGALVPHTTNWTDVTNIMGCYNELKPAQQNRLINIILESFKSSIVEKATKEKLELYSILACILLQQIVKNSKKGDDSTHFLSFFLDSCLSMFHESKRDWISAMYENSSIELETMLTSITRTIHSIIETDHYHQSQSSSLIDKCRDFIAILAIEDDIDCSTTTNGGGRTAARFSLIPSLSCTIIQDLSLLAENVATFSSSILASLEEKASFSLADSVFPSLCSHLLSIKSSKSSSTECTNTKSIQAFLSSSAKTSPLSVQRQLHSLADLMDYEQSGIRMTMTEVFALVIKNLHHCTTTDVVDEHVAKRAAMQQKSLFEVVAERSMDVNAFVRAKALSSLTDIAMCCSASQKDRLLKISTQRLMDKSSAVRRKSIALLQCLLRKHPFSLDGGLLDDIFFRQRLQEVKEHIGDEDDSATAAAAASDHPESMTLEMEKRQQTLLMQEKYYSDALRFTLLMQQKVIPVLLKLMEITSIKGEMCDIMDFFVDCNTFGLKNSDLGINRMIFHVWEKVKPSAATNTTSEDNNSIRDHLLLCFSRLYIEVDLRFSVPQRQLALLNNLLKLLNTSFATPSKTLVESCIECCSIKLALLPPSTVKSLLSLAYKRFMEGISLLDARSSLVLLSIGARLQPSLLKGGMVKGLLERGVGIIKSSSGKKKKKKETLDVLEYLLATLTSLYGGGGGGLRLPLEDPIIYSISSLLFLEVEGSFQWLEGCNKIIRCLSLIAQDFISLSKTILGSLASGDSVGNNWILARNIHISSSIATHLYCHFDVIEQDLLKGSQSAGVDSTGTNNNTDISEESLISKSEEENIKEIVRLCREEELLAPGSPLHSWALCCRRVFERSATANPSLVIIASIALTKFMTISQSFCDSNLSLFLTLLTKHPLEVVRMNCILGFADLATCHSRIVDQNVKSLFLGLMETKGTTGAKIRTRTLTILTHLFLTGMIKVKGWIGWIARAQLDPSPSVRGMAKLFFQELTGKDPLAIYNYIPEIISALSVGSGDALFEASGDDVAVDIIKPLSHDEFKSVAKTIFEYVTRKERQMESLVERLCARIRGCRNWRQIRDIMFSITLVISPTISGGVGNNTSTPPFTSLKRFIESFPLYRDRLHDKQVFSYVEDILQRAKKQFVDVPTPNQAHSSLIKEWENMIHEAAGEDASDNHLMVDGDGGLVGGADGVDDYDQDQEDGDDDDDPMVISTSKPTTKAKKKAPGKAVKQSALDKFKSSVRSLSESDNETEQAGDEMAMMDIDVSTSDDVKGHHHHLRNSSHHQKTDVEDIF